MIKKINHDNDSHEYCYNNESSDSATDHCQRKGCKVKPFLYLLLLLYLLSILSSSVSQSLSIISYQNNFKNAYISPFSLRFAEASNMLAVGRRVEEVTVGGAGGEPEGVLLLLPEDEGSGDTGLRVKIKDQILYDGNLSIQCQFLVKRSSYRLPFQLEVLHCTLLKGRRSKIKRIPSRKINNQPCFWRRSFAKAFIECFTFSLFVLSLLFI